MATTKKTAPKKAAPKKAAYAKLSMPDILPFQDPTPEELEAWEKEETERQAKRDARELERLKAVMQTMMDGPVGDAVRNMQKDREKMKRSDFAGLAMQAMLHVNHTPDQVRDIATKAWQMADAMLEAE